MKGDHAAGYVRFIFSKRTVIYYLNVLLLMETDLVVI